MSTQDQTATQTNIEEPPSDDPVASDQDQTDATTETEVSTELSLDLTFEILKNSRRREVLHYLRDRDDGQRVSLGELAEHVAAIENDTTTEALTSSQRKRVYVGLYQCHLPKMDDIGVVDFNQDRGHVELTPVAEALSPYLDQPAETDQVDWHRYYSVISVIGIAILGLSVGVQISAGVSLALLGLVVGTFAFCSFTHWLTEARTSE